MERGGLNMRAVYILIVLVVAALVLGCVGKKETEISVSPTQTPISPETTVSPAGTPAPAIDEFGTDADIIAIDSLVNDSSMDISLSEVTI